MAYNRIKAVEYAHQWAHGRNPRYLDFHGIGGDCTNFVSQCVFAGDVPQNYKKTLGWYYHSANDRAPAWTSAEYLYAFLMRNDERGPYGYEITLDEIEPGDIVQFSFDNLSFTHSVFVVKTGSVPDPINTLVAAHSDDSDNRPLITYTAPLARRFLKINGRP